MEQGGGPSSPRDTHPGHQLTQATSPALTTKDLEFPNLLNRTSQASCSVGLKVELQPCGSVGSGDGVASPEGPEGPLPSTEAGRSTQRTTRSSAFPSSLAWDSDSEKETLDEEELQHFSNPHGLAAQSPGSPTSGHEPDRLHSEVFQAPEKSKQSIPDKDPHCPVGEHDQGGVSTQEEEPKTTQPHPHQRDDDKARNVSSQGELPLSDMKPKEGCQKEDEQERKGYNQKGKEESGPKTDVYTFPGDSDPESPPPGPWAHCTFIQRRRKKRALLRPFSGQSSWQRTTAATSRKARVTPSRAKQRGKAADDDLGVFDFKEEEEEKKGVEEKATAQQMRVELCQEIFTCVECSVYFRKRAHLRQHMREHGLGGGARKRGQRGERGTGTKRAKRPTFECMECGQEFRDRLALVDHHRRHQESRRKILEEIGKLSKSGAGPADPCSPRRATETSTAGSSPLACGQFVCLKCNFSSDVPQELADHAKTHTARARAALQRTSPRLQPKRRRAELMEPSGGSATCSSGAPPDEPDLPPAGKDPGEPNVGERQSENRLPRLDVRGADGRDKADPASASCRDRPASVPETDLLGQPASATPEADVPPPSEAGQKEESEPTEPLALGEVQRLQPHTSSPNQTTLKAGPQRREVAFKSIGIRRSSRVAKEAIARMQAGTKQDGAPSKTGNKQKQTQKTDPMTELNQKETELHTELPEPKASSKIDPVEVPALAKQLKRSLSAGLWGATERLGLTEGQQAQLRHTLPLVLIGSLCSDLLTPLSNSRVMVDESTERSQDQGASFSPKKDFVKLEEPREESCSDSQAQPDGENTNEDAVGDSEEGLTHFLMGDASGDDDEDDDDSEGGELKSGERQCPYCPECFHNGIGLANHVRGHLNRVGVSYNVRHFISPEEVNAIEKKFSYQKKKKKVANFDPSTFSVMRCEFCSAGFDTRAGLSSHARAHLRDFGITNWEVTVSPINILRELFSNRPDLVIPTAPPSSPPSGDDQEEEPEEKEEEEELGPARGKDEDVKIPLPHTQAPGSCQPSKEKRKGSEALGGGEEEEEEEELEMPLLDNMTPCSEEKLELERGVPQEEKETKAPSLLKCEVCGTPFETRRGLSSHARSHLRQLGVGVSESSGAPIDLLYQITKERALEERLNSPLPSPKRPPHLAPSPRESTDSEEASTEVKPALPISVLATVVKVAPSPKSLSSAGSLPPSPFAKSRSPSPVLRKAPISSLLPVTSPLRSLEHKTIGKSPSSALPSPSKPFWAPQDTDAPLNLTVEADHGKDIICQLCGAWFETRKGLSSHARAHLRHFGVEYSESKGSPIDLLNRLILTDEFKHRASSMFSEGSEVLRGHVPTLQPHSSSPPTSSSKRPLLSGALFYKTSTLGGDAKVTSSCTSSLLAPPTKRPKSSPLQVFRLPGNELLAFPPVEPLKDVGCEFCGEFFENRKGLSSHARSHLRQMGITEWSVNGSPIDTLREVIIRRGLPCVMPLKAPKSTTASPGPGPPRARPSPPSSPGSAHGRLPFPFTHPPSHPQQQPTARRIAVSASATCTTPVAGMVKPKPEPVQVEITMPEGQTGESRNYSTEAEHHDWSSDHVQPINLAMTHDVVPTRDIRCEFCGEYFENRKGLSSHARSHLRQMGITEWSVNGSPIDTLREIMRKRGVSPAPALLGLKKEPGQSAGLTWEGLGFQSMKIPKSPLNLLHSGSRLHKHGLGSVGPASTLPSGKYFGVAPPGKRPQSEERTSVARSPPAQPKSFSPSPPDFSFRGKLSPDKHGVGHVDASCELCGFYFENRKALASHARAHLRQFGVTEWCVNGSPIETLSAWIRSRPHKVTQMHRSYLQGNRNIYKKKSSSSLSPSSDSDHTLTISQKPSQASSWASLPLPQGRVMGREVTVGSWGPSSRTTQGKARNSGSAGHSLVPQRACHPSGSSLPPAQVARSELNVRSPRGFERRPPKHPSHSDGGERDSGPPKPLRSGTIPALVPKPPTTPLVKLVGKIYSLKCRFCDVEFHGPLSVQEDWIRHLQQHILNLNYSKPAAIITDSPAKPDAPTTQPLSSAATSTSTTTTTTSQIPSTTPNITPTLTDTPTPSPKEDLVLCATAPSPVEPVLTPGT